MISLRDERRRQQEEPGLQQAQETNDSGMGSSIRESLGSSDEYESDGTSTSQDPLVVPLNEPEPVQHEPIYVQNRNNSDNSDESSNENNMLMIVENNQNKSRNETIGVSSDESENEDEPIAKRKLIEEIDEEEVKDVKTEDNQSRPLETNEPVEESENVKFELSNTTSQELNEKSSIEKLEGIINEKIDQVETAKLEANEDHAKEQPIQILVEDIDSSKKMINEFLDEEENISEVDSKEEILAPQDTASPDINDEIRSNKIAIDILTEIINTYQIPDENKKCDDNASLDDNEISDILQDIKEINEQQIDELIKQKKTRKVLVEELSDIKQKEIILESYAKLAELTQPELVEETMKKEEKVEILPEEEIENVRKEFIIEPTNIPNETLIDETQFNETYDEVPNIIKEILEDDEATEEEAEVADEITTFQHKLSNLQFVRYPRKNNIKLSTANGVKPLTENEIDEILKRTEDMIKLTYTPSVINYRTRIEEERKMFSFQKLRKLNYIQSQFRNLTKSEHVISFDDDSSDDSSDDDDTDSDCSHCEDTERELNVSCDKVVFPTTNAVTDSESNKSYNPHLSCKSKILYDNTKRNLHCVDLIIDSQNSKKENYELLKCFGGKSLPSLDGWEIAEKNAMVENKVTFNPLKASTAFEKIQTIEEQFEAMEANQMKMDDTQVLENDEDEDEEEDEFTGDLDCRRCFKAVRDTGIPGKPPKEGSWNDISIDIQTSGNSTKCTGTTTNESRDSEDEEMNTIYCSSEVMVEGIRNIRQQIKEFNEDYDTFAKNHMQGYLKSYGKNRTEDDENEDDQESTEMETGENIENQGIAGEETDKQDIEGNDDDINNDKISNEPENTEQIQIREEDVTIEKEVEKQEIEENEKKTNAIVTTEDKCENANYDAIKIQVTSDNADNDIPEINIDKSNANDLMIGDVKREPINEEKRENEHESSVQKRKVPYSLEMQLATEQN